MELVPGDVQDLVGDIALHHVYKVLHLMSVQLQLVHLAAVCCLVYQTCNNNIHVYCQLVISITLEREIHLDIFLPFATWKL